MRDVRTLSQGWTSGVDMSTPSTENSDFSERNLKFLRISLKWKGTLKNAKNALTSNANYCKQKMAFALRVTTRWGWTMSTFVHPLSTRPQRKECSNAR